MMVNGFRVAVLWTGGKDSCLALARAREAGCEVIRLVTFAPPAAEFLAHPLPVMASQAAALGLPHQVIEIVSPYKENYKRGLARLKEEAGIHAVVTGDMDEVCSSPNWVVECCEPCGLKVIRPLWHADRLKVLEELCARQYEVVFSAVKQPWFDATWVGRKLEITTIDALQSIRSRTGLDLCGEQGEYHTLVLNCPEFSRRIEANGEISTRGNLHYLQVRS